MNAPIPVFKRCSILFRVMICLLSFAGDLCAQGIVRVMPLGDSITRGMGAGQNEIPGGYRDPLAVLYTAAGDSFVFVGSAQTTTSPALIAANQQNHEGHGGWRIDQIFSSINNWQANFQPDVVLLHIGTNDILQNTNLGTGGFDTSNAIARLTALMDRMYGNHPDLEIVLSTLIPIQDNRDGFVKNYNAALVSTVLPTFANQGKAITLVDNYANFINANASWKTGFFDDYAHPNATGYSAMATTFSSVSLPEVEGIVFTSASVAGGIHAYDSAIVSNLVLNGEVTLASVSASGSSLGATFPLGGLNDGSAAENANYTYYATSDATGATLGTVTFDLDLSDHYLGYDISSVQAITGWADHNLGAQSFRLFLEKGDAGYADYGFYSNVTELTDGSGSYLSTVSHSDGMIATNVTEVRFVFLNPDQSNGSGSIGDSQVGSNGGTVIHELQVFGIGSELTGPRPVTLELNAQVGNGKAGLDTALMTNLIQNGQSTLAQVTAPTGALSGSFPTTGLNDGSTSANTNYTYYTPDAMPITVTFDLDTTVNTEGYDVSSIEVLSGWGDHYLGEQRFQVLISTDGGPFADFGTYVNDDVTNGDDASYLSTLTAETGLVAQRVTAVRFIFLNPDTSNGDSDVGASQAGSDGGTLIRELQVFGVPSTDSYADWSLQIPNAGERGEMADPDSDGFTNFEEYVFGTSPVSGNGSLTMVEQSEEGLILRWNQRSSGELSYVLEESETMLDGSWSPSSATITDAVNQSEPSITAKEVLIPIDSVRKFVRIKAN